MARRSASRTFRGRQFCYEESSGRRVPAGIDRSRLLLQSEDEQAASRRDGDVLFAVDHVAHRAHGDGATEADLPKHGAVSGVEGVEVTFAGACKEEVAGR